MDGRLSGFERVALRQHLKECRACRAKVEAMSAFSVVIQRTLAGADGPDWTRLAPAPAVAPLREPAARAYVPAYPPEKKPRPSRAAAPGAAARRRSVGRHVVVLSAVLAAVVLAAQPWQPRPSPVAAPRGATVTVPYGPTRAALEAEAVRLAAGRSPDHVTADWAAGQAWLRARGLEGVPNLDALLGAGLVGVSLEHLQGVRVAVAVLDGPMGRLGLYLLPPSGDGAEAHGWADGQELVALAGPLDDWQAVAVAADRAAIPSTIVERLDAVAGL